MRENVYLQLDTWPHPCPPPVISRIMHVTLQPPHQRQWWCPVSIESQQQRPCAQQYEATRFRMSEAIWKGGTFVISGVLTNRVFSAFLQMPRLRPPTLHRGTRHQNESLFSRFANLQFCFQKQIDVLLICRNLARLPNLCNQHFVYRRQHRHYRRRGRTPRLLYQS